MVSPPRTSERAQSIAVLLVLGALVCGAFFFGVGEDFALLVVAVGLLLGAGTLLARDALPAAAVRSQAAFAIAAFAAAALVVNVQTSLSKDSSFAPAWVLAAVPICFVCAKSLDEARRARLVHGFRIVVAAFAAISCVRLLLFGERASLPLTDPNDYASLVYLAWIPFVHERLVRAWTRAPTARERAVEWAGSFVFLVALMATQSRTAGVIVALALAVWATIALAKRQRIDVPLAHAALAAAAFGAVLLASPHDLVANRIATVGAGVDVRLDLVRAAWRMYADHPIQGIGVFCFSLMYGAYRPLTEQVTAGLFVHNDYVQLLAEGGWLLAVLPLALAGAAARGLALGARSAVAEPEFARTGTALAVVAVCAHAAVNFVFYTLALGISIAILAADLSAAPTAQQAAAPRALRVGVVAVVAFGWIAWLYLVLDLTTAAVFQGQRGVPFSNVVRSDPNRQLEYARFAERMNGDRGVPVLAQAMILAGASDSAANDALELFRRAIAVDPWNPLGYIAFAEFVERAGDTLRLRAQERPTDLLLEALAVDPTNVAAIDRLLDIDRRDGRLGDAYELLKRRVVPRLELLKRQDEDAANRYLDAATQLAARVGDDAFAEELDRKREALRGVSAKVYPGWFD